MREVECSVLIAEEEAVQAISLQELLTDAGYLVLGPVPTQSEALQLLERERPCSALVDLHLSDGPALGLTHRLSQISIPFAVLSGSFGALASDPSLHGVPRIEKPYVLAQIQGTLLAFHGRGLGEALSRLKRRLAHLDFEASKAGDYSQSVVLPRPR